MSKPIVVIVCMARSSESWEPQQRPHPWHRCAGGGAVHSIRKRLVHRSKRASHWIVSGATDYFRLPRISWCGFQTSFYGPRETTDAFLYRFFDILAYFDQMVET